MFHVSEFLYGRDLYTDTYYWPCIVFFHPFSVTRYCAVPSCVFDILGCAKGEKKKVPKRCSRETIYVCRLFLFLMYNVVDLKTAWHISVK